MRPDKWKYEPEHLADKVAIVTGGSTGIGRATAAMLASEGVKVCICARNEQHVRDAVNEIKQYGHVIGTIADMSKNDDIINLFAETETAFGFVDILINNAAIANTTMLQGSYDDWDYAIKTDLLAYMACAHEALARMIRRGYGHIVNVGSLSCEVREGSEDVYVAAKAAIHAWSESLRKQVNPKGVKVSLIEPGLVGTPMAGVSTIDYDKLEDELKLLTPEDVAECIRFALIQPPRCDAITIQLRPHLQLI
jgi:NADP-dependent 3-hydroxy acid dehydrogenase YdfG